MAVDCSLGYVAMSVSLGTQSDPWIDRDVGPAPLFISCGGLDFPFYTPHTIVRRLQLSRITTALSPWYGPAW